MNCPIYVEINRLTALVYFPRLSMLCILVCDDLRIRWELTCETGTPSHWQVRCHSLRHTHTAAENSLHTTAASTWMDPLNCIASSSRFSSSLFSRNGAFSPSVRFISSWTRKQYKMQLHTNKILDYLDTYITVIQRSLTVTALKSTYSSQ